jgi:hypothetical protein
MSLKPPEAPSRERVVNVGEENFVKCFDLKRSSFGRNPTTPIFISPTPNRKLSIEKRRHINHLTIMHQSNKIHVPMHLVIMNKHIVSHQSIHAPCIVKQLRKGFL